MGWRPPASWAGELLQPIDHLRCQSYTVILKGMVAWQRYGSDVATCARHRFSKLVVLRAQGLRGADYQQWTVS